MRKFLCLQTIDRNGTEKGGVMVIFAFFMLAMIPLLALSVDSYFMIQGKLEEQNLAEYAALTSLDGYVSAIDPMDPDHSDCKAQALVHLKDMEGKNGVTGLTAGTGWNFTPTACAGSECSGEGWDLTFGTWDKDTNTFTTAPPDLPMDTESINPTIVNAVKINMEVPDNGFVDFFRTTVSGNSNIRLPVSVVAYFVEVGSDRFFRISPFSS